MLTQSRPIQVVVAVLILLGPTLALVVHDRVTSRQHRHLAVREDQVLTEIEVQLRGALQGLADQLYNIRGLYDASDLVNRHEFNVFTQQVLDRKPYIQALEWAPRVPAQEIDTWLDWQSASSVKADWGRIGQRLARSVRSDSRDRFLVTYLNPIEGNEEAIGFDLTSEVRRRTTIERALSTGEICFTPPISLVQGDGPGDLGTLGLLPCEGGLDVASPAGILVAVFKYKDIFAPALKHSSSTSSEFFEVNVRDGDDSDRVIFSSSLEDREEHPAGDAQWRERDLSFGGRRFILEGRMTEAFRSRYAEGHPWLSGLSSMIGFWLLLGLGLRWAHCARIKSEESRNRVIRSVLGSLFEGVLITDTNGHIKFANSSIVRILGEDAVGGELLCLTDIQFFKADGRTPIPLEQLPFSRAASGEPVELERLLIRRSSEEQDKWISVTGGPILDGEMGRTGGVCVLREITDRIVKEEQENELRLAREVQDMLFPKSIGEGSILEVSGYSQPAGTTSGDYYDFIEQDDGSVVLVVCDISGHGLGPALIMAEVRAMLLTMLKTTRDLSLVMRNLNQTLCRDLPDGCFATMLLARLTPGARGLEYVNAGHPPLVIFDSTGQVRHRLSNTSVALGISPEATFVPPPTVPVEDGDLLLLFTDGLDEAQDSNGDLLGQNRLEETISGASSSSTDELLEQVRDLVRSFDQGSGQGDDQTMLLCRIRREAGEPLYAT